MCLVLWSINSRSQSIKSVSHTRTRSSFLLYISTLNSNSLCRQYLLLPINWLPIDYSAGSIWTYRTSSYEYVPCNGIWAPRSKFQVIKEWSEIDLMQGNDPPRFWPYLAPTIIFHDNFFCPNSSFVESVSQLASIFSFCSPCLVNIFCPHFLSVCWVMRSCVDWRKRSRNKKIKIRKTI